MLNRLPPISLLMIAALVSAVEAEENFSTEQLHFFENQIRPALINYCYECHSQEEKSSRGGLFVDTRKALLQGGDGGPAVVPGNAVDSILWDAINWQHGYEMPPDDPMPEEVIAHFKTWIEMGLPDPRVREVTEFNSTITAEDIDTGKKHWAFQLPTRQSNATVDSIIDAGLDEANLSPVPRADPFTLLRRINFDLIGLPPTLAEIQAFRSDWQHNPDKAVEEKVDDLLARPQFGERWGRHWLDVARYAESSGSRNVSYPNAWRYRDYVIDAFNKDKPFDRFLEEQIAGDLLPAPTDADWQENLIATGFLAIGLKHHDQKNPRQFESDMIDEQIDTLTQGFLGLTVGCARCHDHKYDPIPTQDYYSIAGILQSTRTFFGTNRVAQIHRTSPLLLLPIPDKAPVTSHGRARSVEDLKSSIAKLEKEMASMGRTGGMQDREAGKDRKHLRNNLNRLKGQLNVLNEDGTPKSYAMGVQEGTEMVNANILLGGELERPAQQVPRGFLQVLGDLNFEVDSDSDSGRLQLARAMSTPHNPLTHRVMANRVWMHLMGRPIVATPGNFGLSGMKPENQQLLDHLAVRFVDHGWSMKRLIREIMLTKAYQRDSTYSESNYGVDPDNKLLWRANPRPLAAEELRDASLLLSGEIDLERPLGSAIGENGAGRPRSSSEDPYNTYRSVYLTVARDEPNEMMKTFDFPDPNVTNASRAQSIVPMQALYMMNSEFITQRGQAMAELLKKNFRTDNDRIANAFLFAYGRPATDKELQASYAFFREFEPPSRSSEPVSNDRSVQGRGGKGGKGGKGKGGRETQSDSRASSYTVAAHDPLAVFCQTLMSSARFRILN